MPIDLSSTEARSTFERAIAIAQSLTETNPVRRAAKIRTLMEPELATAALAQAELKEADKKWLEMVESASRDAARISREMREILRAQGE